ncbi:MAG: hypothetical protein LQ351_005487 [Letrouitia transgressa]|nr:MAG: hypothetical protein LQ351_005487 [Letrouitia transgressa]
MSGLLVKEQPWGYSTIAAQRLTEDIVNSYLTKTLGRYQFYVQLMGDEFRFWAPRKLSKVRSERPQIGRRKRKTKSAIVRATRTFGLACCRSLKAATSVTTLLEIEKPTEING